MTTATTKPRAPRKPKVTQEPAQEPETPTCSQCRRELTWRDDAYVGKDAKGSMCKVCHQRAERKRLQGRFVPTTRTVERGGKLETVPVKGNRSLRRNGFSAAPSSFTPAPPEPKERRRTRASRRAAARRDRHGGTMEAWPAELRVREFPTVAESAVSR